MQGFYNVTTKIQEQLLQDKNVKTVTYGDLMDVDLDKQTIFPLSHFNVSNAVLNGNVWAFDFALACMDIVDETKNFRTTNSTGQFRLNTNEQDIWNTQLAVVNRLTELLRRGDLYVEKYQLSGSPSMQPFTDRFENKLCGWSVAFTIEIPNDMTICPIT
jgi:hypothetical protein|tara:strand:+ start:4859 stop:5335 length:477 start_codon:yes stop_codon:yes gene_type:complete